MNIKKIWDDAKKQLPSKISSVGFDLWIKPLVAEAFEDGTFILSAPTKTNKEQAERESNFKNIEEVLKEVAPIIEKVQIIDAIEKEKRTAIANGQPEPKVAHGNPSRFNVNPNQTFDNFVVGSSNQIVCAASQGVAKNPGKSINPLFIYGGTGLGKTHLLNAIANYILQNSPKTIVAYATSENFTNDYVKTMMKGANNSIDQFRQKYRLADILLLDDIQFLRDKNRTQEEFFHTFNDLVQNGKQIVLTSDRHPDEMPTLEERMRSRFKMGLIQDMQAPDLEMWLAIIEQKAKAENYRFKKECCMVLAKHAVEHQLNVREVEGHITKIIFFAKLAGKNEPDIDDCTNALKEVGDNTKYQTTAENIIDQVCKYFDITRDDIVGKRRNREFVEPRMIAIYLIAEILNIPLMNIGKLIGGRDHTTVMHSRNNIDGRIKSRDERICRIVKDLRKLVNNE